MGVLETATDRFERRLSEELGNLRVGTAAFLFDAPTSWRKVQSPPPYGTTERHGAKAFSTPSSAGRSAGKCRVNSVSMLF
jgi:hypothetical protein